MYDMMFGSFHIEHTEADFRLAKKRKQPKYVFICHLQLQSGIDTLASTHWSRRHAEAAVFKPSTFERYLAGPFFFYTARFIYRWIPSKCLPDWVYVSCVTPPCTLSK